MNPVFVETFLAVVHSGTVSGASKRLFVSQSSVSDRINQLEELLGVTLIERKRGSRNITLTEKGKQFVLLAERYMDLEKEIEYFMQDKNEVHISISAAPSVLTFMFTDVLCEMMNSERQLKIKLSSPTAHTTYQQIESLEADIGFIFFPQNFENVITRPFLNEDMVLLLSSRNEWPDRAIAPSELDPGHEILARWSPEIETWRKMQWPSSRRPSIRLEYANILGNILAAESDMWSLCPKSVALKLKTEMPELHIRECSCSIPQRTCYVLTRRNINKESREAIDIFYRILIPSIKKKDYFHLL